MAVRRPEFIPFCYVTSAIKFIYSATQSRRFADAGELPEVPGPPPCPRQPLALSPPRPSPYVLQVKTKRRTNIGSVRAIVSDVL